MKNKSLVVFEALKEVARWGLLFVVSWFITQTLDQVVAIPETQEVRVWVFVYAIPVRTLVQLGLTTLGRLVDRAIHESKSINLSGILPF